jgi:hypothetical protein
MSGNDNRFGEIKMSDKKMPFCWKCASAIKTLTKGQGAFELTGCTECSDIKCYADAETMCPLIDHSPKVVIAIIDGAVHILRKPNNVDLEVRDYDVPEDMEAKVDSDGKRYQEMVWGKDYIDLGSEAVIVKHDGLTGDEPDKYTNYYRHNKCDAEWQDDHSCQCDDECPVCGTAISPYKSDDIVSGETENHHDPEQD